MFLLSVFAVGIGVGIGNQRWFGQTHRSVPTVQIVYLSLYHPFDFLQSCLAVSATVLQDGNQARGGFLIVEKSV